MFDFFRFRRKKMNLLLKTKQAATRRRWQFQSAEHCVLRDDRFLESIENFEVVLAKTVCLFWSKCK